MTTHNDEPGLSPEEQEVELEDTLAADLEGTDQLSADAVNEDNFGTEDEVAELSPLSMPVPLEDQEL